MKCVAVILSVAILPILGQFIHDGECPTEIEVVQNFDVEKVNGKYIWQKRRSFH